MVQTISNLKFPSLKTKFGRMSSRTNSLGWKYTGNIPRVKVSYLLNGSEEVIARRMADAVAEMSHWEEFDYLVVNDSFDMALADLHSIIHSGRLVRQRQSLVHEELIASLLV